MMYFFLKKYGVIVCVSWLGACNFVRLVTAIIVSIGYVGDRLHVGVVHGDSLNAE